MKKHETIIIPYSKEVQPIDHMLTRNQDILFHKYLPVTVSDRLFSGVTTILSTASTGMMVRDGLPRVPYATALDVYLNVCIVYNLAAMIEYAAVNYFTKIIPKEGSTSDNEEEQVIQQIICDNHLFTLKF